MASLIAALLLALLTYAAGMQGLASGLISLLSLGFLLGVPFGIGYATVRSFRLRSRAASTIAGWGPIAMILAALYLTGWEGTVCIVMVSPLLLLGATAGGLTAQVRGVQAGRTELTIVLALPFALMPAEGLMTAHDRIGETENSIEIAASADRVWDEIAEVDSIREEERSIALYTAIGFPAPLAATLDFPQEGGVRVATFERGIRFVETITEWEPEERLAFEIRADRAAGEPALDQHVSIGGPHFDVLAGTYTIERLDSARTRLVLGSRHRVTTRLNAYAGWWADRVMSSVQRSILEVIRDRAESSDRAPKARIRAATVARRSRTATGPLEADSRATGFSVSADFRGHTDIYPESLVVLVRAGELFIRPDSRPQRFDSITASLARSSGSSWSPGSPSNAVAMEWPAEDTTAKSLGPMRRFTIPRDTFEPLTGSWVVFSFHLTVPKTAENPYGLAWTYAHDAQRKFSAP